MTRSQRAGDDGAADTKGRSGMRNNEPAKLQPIQPVGAAPGDMNVMEAAEFYRSWPVSAPESAVTKAGSSAAVVAANLVAILDRNVVGDGEPPHRVQVDGKWYTGPLADIYIETVIGIRETLRLVAAAPPENSADDRASMRDTGRLRDEPKDRPHSPDEGSGR